MIPVTGDIVFFRTRGFLPRMIQMIAGLRYNHVGVVVYWGSRPMLVEAVGKGIVAVPVEDRIYGADIKVCRPNRSINVPEYRFKATDKVGNTPYDYLGLLVHQLVLNVCGKYIGKMKSKEDDAFYCYEFAAYMNEEDVPEWHKVNPKEFQDADWHSTVYQGVLIQPNQ